MDCHYFDAGICRSCRHMGEDYSAQVQAKQSQAEHLLRGHAQLQWQAPVTGPAEGFRNKAKMVVSGTAQEPTLGILDRQGRGVDLSECGLYPAPILQALPVLREFIRTHALTPYDVPARRGELKHLLVTCSPDGELMVRFVLRSKKLVVPIRSGMPELVSALPSLRVLSCNILREHKAVLEGPEEVLLSAQGTLPMRVNGLSLHLRPQGFFQTNTDIAAAMYRQGAQWLTASGPRSVLDLYCGVGGFGLHAARALRRAGSRAQVLGVEISEEAVRAARTTARELGLEDVAFRSGDAQALAQEADADAVLVNPPRRGIGALASCLEECRASTLVYSSCNASSLAADLERLPSWTARQAVVLDMFPQTDHFETMVLLRRD